MLLGIGVVFLKPFITNLFCDSNELYLNIFTISVILSYMLDLSPPILFTKWLILEQGRLNEWIEHLQNKNLT